VTFSSYFDYTGAAPGQAADEAVLLPDLDDAGWAKLLAHMHMLRCARGDVVIRAGDRDRALYIVADGALELLPDETGAAPAGRPEPIAPGAVIGELSFFDGRPRSATIRAAGDCELFRLDIDDFEVLAAREPVLARTLLLGLGRILALRLRRFSAAEGV
jgi:CRP-like cAMP-binding protein